jgi:hypothetical protein
MSNLRWDKYMLIAAGVVVFTGRLPYLAARVSSSIYIAAHYPTEGFEFERAEYLYGFGDYGVVYRDKDGSTPGLGLQMFPKEFPIFIRYDSIKKHG